jgi:hypothetical protein
MGEVSFVITDRQVATVRLDPNSLQGRDAGGLPQLYLPLKLQLLPGGQRADVQYTIVRLAGLLQSQQSNEFGRFEVSPLAAVPNPNPYERPQDAFVPLDRLRIKRFEDARAGGDAHFQIMLSCLVWYPAEQRFDAPTSSGYLDVLVPKSHWAENIVPMWNLSYTRLVEIQFPKGSAGDNFRASYARVEEAEKLFASGHYKQVLTTLRLSFEALANSLGFERRVRECFESLFASGDPDKREKARDALTGIYKFLHLGPHEQINDPGVNVQPAITQQDARFALTTAYAIYEYITTKA